MRSYAATWPTVEGAVNEDAVAASRPGSMPLFGIVADGAGLGKQWRAGCHHEVAWFSHLVAHALATRLSAVGGDAISLREHLRSVLAEIRDLHHDQCDLDAGSPSATLAMWRYVPDQRRLDHLVLCDASLVLAWEDGAQEITDDAVTGVWRRVATTFAAEHPHLDPASAEFIDRRTEAIEGVRNKPGGFWLCGPDPQAADHAVTGSITLDEDGRTPDGRRLLGIVAASDGATRGFQLFGLHTVDEFARLTLAGPEGAGALHAAIRAHETRNTHALATARKVHDDLSVAALSSGGMWENSTTVANPQTL